MPYKYNAFISDLDLVNLVTPSVQIDQKGGTSDSFGILGGTLDGVNRVFTVSLGSYGSGKLLVYLNGQLQTQGTGEDYIELSAASGTFQFATAPAIGSKITAIYNLTAVTSSTITWGNISGTLVSQTDLNAKLTSFQIIKQASDWGTPVAGVVTLTSGTYYYVDFVGEMTLPFRLALPNGTGATRNVIFINGNRASGTTLRLDSSLTGQALLSGGNNCNCHIYHTGLRASGVGQKIFDIDMLYPTNAAFGVFPIFQMFNVTLTSSTEVGTIKNVYGLDLDKLSVVASGQGFTFNGVVGVGISRTVNTLANASGFILYNFATTLTIQNRLQFDTQSLNLGTNQTGFKIANNLTGSSLLFTSLAYSTSASGTTAIDVTPTAIIPNGGLLIKSPGFKMTGTGSTGIRVQSGATVLDSGLDYDDAINNVATGNIGLDFSATAVASPRAFNIRASKFTGSGTYLTGLTVQDNKIISIGNSGLVDTKELGSYSFQNLTTGTLNTTATTGFSIRVFKKIAGTTNSNFTFKFTHTNNRLTYTDSEIRDFAVSFSGSATGASNNTEIRIILYKNGITPIWEGLSATKLTTATDNYAISFTAIPITLTTNDYIELFVANDTNTKNITLTTGTLTIK